MSAPRYVPHGLADRPRRGEALPPADRWTAARPADLSGRQPGGDKLGRQGPDQGYVLRLLHLFDGTLVLTAGEHAHDVEAGAVGVALKRASLFGRAPVKADLDVAFTVFGYLGAAPDDLVRFRRELFDGAGHDYRRQRAIADAVPDDTLRLVPDVVAARAASDWRSLLSAAALAG